MGEEPGQAFLLGTPPGFALTMLRAGFWYMGQAESMILRCGGAPAVPTATH